jgi:hypothetical protein
MPPSCQANAPGGQGLPKVGTDTPLVLTLLEIQLKMDVVLPSKQQREQQTLPNDCRLTVQMEGNHTTSEKTKKAGQTSRGKTSLQGQAHHNTPTKNTNKKACRQPRSGSCLPLG